MLENKKYIIVIGGPTASGKTALAVEVAEYFKTEIISTDSRQFYNEMNIGVARPEPEYLARVPHHFVASYSVFDPIDAFTFAVQAENKIHEILAKKNEVVLTGGSGFYIKALLEGLDEMPKKDEAQRDELNQLLKEKGLSFLQHILLEKNPELYAITEIKNPQRVIRAIEIASGNFEKNESAGPKEWKADIIRFYINPERETLYQNINKRVDIMIEKGLEKEAQELLPYRNLAALKTVGYSELFDYFDDRISREEAIGKIKQHTRNYAKRQKTWFKNQNNYIALEGSITEMTNQIINTIKNGK